MPASPAASPGTHEPAAVELQIGGMTCASCAMRIERKLNKLDGVEASVNYATEKALIHDRDGLGTGALVAEVQKAGYAAEPVVRVVPPAVGDVVTSPDPEGEGHAGSPSAADPAPDPELVSLRQRLLGAIWLSVPVIVLAMVPPLQFTSWQWASLVLAAPVATWAAWPFHRAAWTNARHGAATMDTLISVGVSAAFLWSLYALFLGTAGRPGMTHHFEFSVMPSDSAGDIYLEVAAGVTMFVLAGRYAERRAKRQAGEALRKLLGLGAKDVAVLRDGRESRIPISALTVGDEFLVRPGEKVATDGVVVTGASAIDASMITGESVPVEVGAGDAVVGATINRGGQLVVRATRVGEQTQLAQMARLVEQAQTGKAKVQRLADQVSAIFVPIVFAIAAITLAAWLLTGHPVTMAFGAAVAVLIIACPCALGLATPTALLVGTGRGAQLGILIKGPEVLESARGIDTIVLDKTGTVTTGTMSVLDVVTANPSTSTDEVLRLGASLESASEHPIARAIVGAAEAHGLTVERPTDFANREGLGVVGTVAHKAVLVGRPVLFADTGVQVPAAVTTAMTEAEARGATVVLVGWEGQARGCIVVADEIKPTSAEAIRDLRALGLRPILLTGDNPTIAAQVAQACGIDEVHAGVLPADKVGVVRALQAEGRVVAMVGDGVNDAPALAQADLGLAMGTGTDVAIEAADIAIVSGDLRAVVDAVRLSRRTLGTIRSNLFWAFAYNVLAIPLAAFGLLNPMLAGAAMAFSSVGVVGNSLRLRSFRDRRN